MNRELSVHVTRYAGPRCAVVTVSGDLDKMSVPLLKNAVNELVVMGNPRIVLDVEGLTFCDSTGLGAFVAAMRATSQASGWLRLAGVPGHLENILCVTDLYRRFLIDPDVIRSLEHAFEE
ncbi:STAS domain-containing protein [Planobispora takensis]|uniref:Anti-sigma factor antagonist n=1 Tax=Planobispora takensis TaxID=1367882 RepID=A0A8J3SZY1_9ACTN|nr:STAS domain-containing protein [Planobispora takensis]GII02412.1 hypothetical protein Pta02_44200 [Planobispora takensis]